MVALAFACGDKPKKAATAPRSRAVVPEPSRPGEPQRMLGQLCPSVAAGRPALVPVAVLAGVWSAAGSDAERFIASRMARQFSVLSWQGERAGVLAVAGLARSDDRAVAIGSYAGGLPCADREGKAISECVAATGGCGVAIARLEPSGGLQARPFEEDPEPLELATARVCIDGDELSVDIDGDGRLEVFERSAIASGGTLAAELMSRSSAQRACEGSFASGNLGAGVSLLGAADFDGDARIELVISLRAAGREQWAIYRAAQTAARLERVALAEVHYSSAHSQSGAERPATN